jgi:hypothetical protein
LKPLRTPLSALVLFGCLAGAPAPAQEPAASPTPAPSPAPPRRVEAIELTGVTRFDKETVWQTMGVKPGGTLRRDPADLARLVEEHYRTLGYAAVEVQARFDEAAGVLRLAVDEGLLKSVDVQGVRESEKARVLSLVELKPGQAFNDEGVADALRRLESDSSGAFEAVGDPPYTLRREDDGVRLTLTLRHRSASVGIGPGGIGVAALYNRVDGFAPGVTARSLIFWPSAFNPIELYGHAHYAFSDERVPYALGALKRFGARGPLVLGYEHHDFTDNDHVYRANGVEQLHGWHFFFTTFQDYYRRKGDEAYLFVRPSDRFQLGVNFRSDRFDSQPVVSDNFLFFRQDPPPNPPVAEGLSRSFLFTARWSWKEPLFPDWGPERNAFLVRDPYGTAFVRHQVLRAEGTLEVADADALGGVFTFTRFTGHVRGAARLSLRHTLLGRVTVGLGSQDLPPQRRFSLGGNGTLRGRERDDVTGDSMLLTSGEWHIEPNSPWPALIVFYDGGSAWDEGAPRPQWRHDAGLGLTWPPGESRFIRMDVGFPLNTLGGSRSARVTGFVRVPF